MKNKNLLIYRIVTGIFSLMLLAGAITYFVNYEMTAEMFTSLGVPTSVIYPLAIAKIMGIIAIWFINIPLLKHLAYLGFAIDLISAIIAHINVNDGGAIGPAVPLVLLIISFIYFRKLNSDSEDK